MLFFFLAKSSVTKASRETSAWLLNLGVCVLYFRFSTSVLKDCDWNCLIHTVIVLSTHFNRVKFKLEKETQGKTDPYRWVHMRYKSNDTTKKAKLQKKKTTTTGGVQMYIHNCSISYRQWQSCILQSFSCLLLLSILEMLPLHLYLTDHEQKDEKVDS